MGVAKFSVGSDTWPGALKAAEEMFELLTLLMKLLAVDGAEVSHSGVELQPLIEDETADVLAALEYLTRRNRLSVADRRRRKLRELLEADMEAKYGCE